MKKYIVEVIGTFALTLVVGLSLAHAFPVPTPILAGLTLGLFVYTIGTISGTHINPAVTIGVWSIKKISTKDALLYILSQIIGAGIAMLLIMVTVGMPHLTVVNSWMVAFAELLGTFFFTFGVASVVYGKNPDAVSGIVVGTSLFIGITIAACLGSNGVLNPAVAFGIGSFNLAYLGGIVIGGVLGMQAFKYLSYHNKHVPLV